MDIDRINEAELIRKSLTGDSSQFEILFNRYKPVIKEFLVKLSGNEFDSNDLLQESFIKAYLNLDKYNPEYSFIQWLHTIARNTFIDHVRRKTVKESLLFFDSCYMTDIIGDNPEELMLITERQKRLDDYIKTLDENSRIIIELRYFKSLSYEEISAELGIPIGTVKNRLYRAKEKLSLIIKDK